jgi:hypothetical protein
MPRQRRNVVQLAGASDSPPQPPIRNHPLPSEPLALYEPLPSTFLGQLYYYLRELFRIARHGLYLFVFGVGYDLTLEERRARAPGRQAQQGQRHHPEDERDTALLGHIRNTYQLRWRPGSHSVMLCGDVVAGEQDPFAHAVAAYAHCGLDTTFTSTSKHSTSRIVAYTGSSAPTTLRSFDEPYTFPTFEHVPYGSIQAFLLTTPSYPSLRHPDIPPNTAQSALPFHWLLNLASAVTFLHSHGVAHGALALDLLWLRTDFSTALFDLTNSVYTGYNEYDEKVPIDGGQSSWGSFPFPINDVDGKYFSGATPEDAMALGKMIDVFDFGTVAWRLLTRTVEGAPGWKIPQRKAGEREWSLTELQLRFQEADDAAGAGIGRGRYMPLGLDVVRKCWRLEYRDGGEVLEAFRKMVLETGLKVRNSDEVEGVAQAVENFKMDYRPKSYLGNELFSEHGIIL